MTTTMREIVRSIGKSIIAGQLAVFCGAGISKKSGLLLADELKQYILEKLPIDRKDIAEITTSRLPFEAFVETISENTDISKILEIFENGEPNTDHILIAKLAKNDYLKVIFTTNFDLLIEKALQKEGLKRDIDFEVYYDEEQFSRIDFDNKKDGIIRIFKIHGSIEDRDSIRTTMKAVASKTLSDKRMSAIRYLLSSGNHKKVLVLGYSCSDEFDITPQIQSVEENQKEIILIEHHKEGEEIEDIKLKELRNPFKKFPGRRIKCKTDDLIKDLWASLEGNIGEYKPIESRVNWKAYLDDWYRGLKQEPKYFVAGSILYNISNFKRAIDYYEKALEIDKVTGNKTGEANCYTNLGNAYYGLGNFKKDIEYQEKALEIDKITGNKTGEASCYTNLGNAYYGLGNFKKDIECQQKALEVAEQLMDKAGKSRCYIGLGNAYGSLGNFKEDIKYQEKALEIKREMGDKAGELKCYMNLGNAYYGLGDFRKNIEYQHKALEIAKVIGDKGAESTCYRGLGISYRNLGDFARAIGFYKKALEIVKTIKDRAGEALCYTSLGNAYRNLGDSRRAIEYHGKALEIAKEIGDKAGEARCYANLGNADYASKNFEKGVEYQKKALEIAKEIGDKAVEAACYASLGNADYALGNFEKGVEYQKKALEIAKEIGDKAVEAACYVNLGNAFHSLRDFRKAIEYYSKAEKIIKETGEIHYLKEIKINRITDLVYEKIWKIMAILKIKKGNPTAK